MSILEVVGMKIITKSQPKSDIKLPSLPFLEHPVLSKLPVPPKHAVHSVLAVLELAVLELAMVAETVPMAVEGAVCQMVSPICRGGSSC